MILLAASCLAVALAAMAVQTQDPAPAKIDAVFTAFNKPNVPGCSVAVERDGKVVYAKGYGLANLEYDVANSPSTVFHVASLSKQITAFAIQLLAAQGKLKLDDDIRKFVPEMHDFGKVITISNLLHHTSGLRDQWHLVMLGGWRIDDVITQDDLLGLLFRQRELNFDPGARYVYCNSGYTLLALIVQRVSGKSLRDFCEAQIFKPLKMTQTHFHDDYTEIVPNRAVSYDPKDGGGFHVDVLSFSNVGATSLFTTVEDFAKWSHNLVDPKVGGSKVLEQMLSTPALNDGRANLYASGVALGTYRGLKIIEHSGSDAGYRSEALIFPAQSFSVECFANVGSANPSSLAREVADLYLGSLLTPKRAAPRPVSVDAKVLKSYAGCYQFDPGRVAVIAFKKGKLTFTTVGADPIEMLARSPTRFRVPGVGDVEFSQSKPSGLGCKLVNGDGDFPGKALGAWTPDVSELEAYAGDYYSDELGQMFHVGKVKDGLRLTFLKNDAALLPVARDMFGFEGWVVKFDRDPDGHVTRMFFSSGRCFNIRCDRSTIIRS